MDVSETAAVTAQDDALLTDTHELDDAAPTSAADVAHRVACPTEGCGAGATIRMFPSGNGFLEVERFGINREASLGIGEHGRPVCPEHGLEMAFADERQAVPAHEAITQAAEQLAARQPRMPFPVPDFNHANALHAIYTKQREVTSIENRHKGAKERVKEIGEELAAAEVQLRQMIVQFERDEADRHDEQERRDAAAARGEIHGADGSRLMRCVYEQQTTEACPICDDGIAEHVLARILGAERAPTESDRHLDDVTRLRDGLAVDEIEDALHGVIAHYPRPRIEAWASEDREAVKTWAYAVTAHLSDASVVVPERPAVLGTAHIAKKVKKNATEQVCQACGAVLLALGDADVDDDPWDAGQLVGAECPGAAASDGHHYPETKKKKAGTKPARSTRS